MAVEELPVKVESLDDLPEEVRGLYREADDGFRLPVKGVKTEEEVSGLESALRKLKEDRNQWRDRASRVSDEDLEELENLRAERKLLEEKQAAAEGRLDEIRAKWKEEENKRLAEKDQVITKKDQVIERLAVKSQLKESLVASGVLPEYVDDAYRALMERRPKAKEVDGDVVGVFPDEVHGDKLIPDFVAEWVKSEGANKYMPRDVGGGGAGGEKDRGVKTTKKVSDMTDDEKADLIDELQDRYGENWQREWYKLVSAT